jgi:hypothetical protein
MKREHNKNYDAWWYVMPKVMLVYNNFKIHSTIKMTPKDARKKKILIR